MWADNTLIERLGLRVPIVQAPMAGASGSDLAISVIRAGGLGSLPCAMLSPQRAAEEITRIREGSQGPVNLNFFCHETAAVDTNKAMAWIQTLAPYYSELGLALPEAGDATGRSPFGEEMCLLVEEYRPEVVSFHFGLPSPALLDRVKAAGALVMSSATTVREARWLEDYGCDVIIAQGYEAGGHRGVFLDQDVATQPGTMALVPQVSDAVSVPVIAAGGIGDARGLVAALALGAAAVQMGTVFLFTPQALISDLHREALAGATDDGTALTNIFSGRPARGLMNRIMREVGPMSEEAPAFPAAGAALAPLKTAAEAAGSSDFTSLWSGQAAALAQILPADELVQELAAEALKIISELQVQ